MVCFSHWLLIKDTVIEHQMEHTLTSLLRLLMTSQRSGYLAEYAAQHCPQLTGTSGRAGKSSTSVLQSAHVTSLHTCNSCLLLCQSNLCILYILCAFNVCASALHVWMSVILQHSVVLFIIPQFIVWSVLYYVPWSCIYNWGQWRPAWSFYFTYDFN